MLTRDLGDDDGGSGSGNKTVRISTISLCLKTTLRNSPNAKKILHRIDTMAKHTGFFRRITGLLANYIVSRKLEQGLDAPLIKKLFYDRCWASINHAIGGFSRSNEFGDLVREFFDRSGFDVANFPPTVDTRLQESVTREMEISAKASIHLSVESRIRTYIRFKLLNHSPHFNSLEKNKKIRDLSLVTKYVLEPALDEFWNLNIHSEYSSYIQTLRSFLVQARQESISTTKPLEYIMKVKPKLFLVLLQHISLDAQASSDIFHQITAESLERFPNENDKDHRKEFVKDECRRRRIERKIKTTSLLPMWALKPAFPYYSTSVVKKVFKEYRDSDVSEFMRDNFDYTRVSRKGYVPSGFRSDGVQVQISFMALKSSKPPPIGTENLVKAGYKIPNRSVDTLKENKGIFKVYQSKTDARKIREPGRFRITTVDPGCSSVISTRVCDLDKCDSPLGIVNDGIESSDNVWEIKGSEYKKMSGADVFRKRENRRRSDPAYAAALNSFSSVRKKTALSSSIVDYCRVVAESINVLYAEKNRRSRRVTRMHRSGFW